MFLPPTNAGHFAIVSFQDDSLVPSKVANDNGIVFTNIDDCVGTILELYLVVFLCRFLCFHAARTRLTRSHNSHMALTFVDHPYKKFPIRAVADPKVPSWPRGNHIITHTIDHHRVGGDSSVAE